MEVTTIDPWACPTCRQTVSTPFCPTCGERPLLARELTIRGLFDQVVQSFTSIDGRLVRSVRYLVGRPGFLTVAYLQGQRKPYVGPVSLFLMANALFFATESLTGGRVFTTPLDSHLHTQPWSGAAEWLVSHRLAAKQMTREAYAPVFNRAVALNARSLIVLMALSFAVALSLVFFRTTRPRIAHALFSLHFYAFLLLLFSVATAVPPVDLWLGGAGFASGRLDDTLSVGLLLTCAAYLYVATGRVYDARGSLRALRVAALTTAAAAIVLGYRFVLLLVTLYST
jgi:hypothetical protein